MSSPTYYVLVESVVGSRAVFEMESLQPGEDGFDERFGFAVRLVLDVFERAVQGHFFSNEGVLPVSREALAAKAAESPLREALEQAVRDVYGYDVPLSEEDNRAVQKTGAYPDGTKWQGSPHNGRHFVHVAGDWDRADALGEEWVRSVTCETLSERRGRHAVARVSIEFTRPALAAVFTPGLAWHVYF